MKIMKFGILLSYKTFYHDWISIYFAVNLPLSQI
jgi:hypothetical protein